MGTLFEELKRRNVVRVAVAYLIVAWLVAQVADLGLENFGAPDWVIKTILFLLVLGFPLAIFFAWAFELTPEGLKRDKDVDRSQPVAALRGRKLDFVIIGTLVIALGYFVWDRQADVDKPATPVATTESAGDPYSTLDRRSIAVLPFVNMSSDPEQEWFADGLTEELLNALSRAPDLLVAARTSSFKYKGTNEDVPTIAKALGVAHVLEGSVRRGRDRLRITAQLIRANDGFHLWSQSYDRKPDDVIAIQEELAVEIARALDTAMDPEALAKMLSAGTTSVPAYEAYLEGLAYGVRSAETGDEQLLLKRRTALERAQALDPGFAAAHWEMAQFWQTQMSVTSFGSELTSDTAEQRKAKYKTAIDRAIETAKDPVTRTRYRANAAAVDLRLNDALELITDYVSERPKDYLALDERMTLLTFLRRWNEAHEVADELAALAGEDSNSMQSVIQTLVFVNDPAAAARVARRGLELHPDNAMVRYQAHRALLWNGNIDAARELVPSIAASQITWFNKDLVRLRQACAEGDLEEAQRIHARFVDEFDEGQAVVWLSYHWLGMPDEANAVLMNYDRSNQLYSLASYLAYPYFDPRPFPNLMKWVKRERIRMSQPVEIPHGCKIVSDSNLE